MIDLPYDPYQIFSVSTSPVGLYARQKWLRQERNKNWQADFNDTVLSLREGQSPDGSWGGSFLTTVRRLFGLHLTVRHPDRNIRKGVGWLTEHAVGAEPKELGIQLSSLCRGDLQGLPFVPGDPRFLALSMTLFLTTIFGQGDDSDIVARYRGLSQALADPAYQGDIADMNNILRAFVVHPRYAGDQATVHMVDRLSNLQDDQGNWPDQIPFYQTVNALAHLHLPQADRQLVKAFQIFATTQHPDGTWGTTQSEWNTFLVIHALRNKRALQ
jgi:hypothetical protein